MVRRCNSPLAADSLLFKKGCDCDHNVYEAEWFVGELNRGQSVYYISHPFGKRYLEVFVYDIDAGCEIYPAVYYVREGLLNVGFTSPPRVGQRFKIRVIYHGESK